MHDARKQLSDIQKAQDKLRDDLKRVQEGQLPDYDFVTPDDLEESMVNTIREVKMVLSRAGLPQVEVQSLVKRELLDALLVELQALGIGTGGEPVTLPPQHTIETRTYNTGESVLVIKVDDQDVKLVRIHEGKFIFQDPA